MCIRDRPLTYNRDMQLDKEPLFDSIEIVSAELAVLSGLVTVAYTHLRAHETVLDLVCRLLLEKKNPASTHAIPLALLNRD